MKLKKLHSLLAILLITAVAFSMMLLPGCRSSGLGAANLGSGKLSDMDDEALLQYIQDCGVTLVEDADDLEIARTMIQALEKDPYSGMTAAVSDSFLVELYDEMRRVVRLYYGIET